MYLDVLPTALELFKAEKCGERSFLVSGFAMGRYELGRRCSVVE